ncbi:MAG: YybS family protein [Clostridiales bacterium]|nr:YybS family protein [Clostridiales bacterium]MCF8022494.1 YybS family protein [Clostridiales bacterium]
MLSYINKHPVSHFIWLTAVEIILALAMIYVFPLQYLFMVIFPLPVALMVRKYHLNLAVLVLIGIALLMCLMTGNVLNIISSIIQYGIIGLAIGLLYKNHVSPLQSLTMLILLSIITTIFIFIIMYINSGISPFHIGKEYFAGVKEVSRWYRELNLLNAEEQKQLLKQLKNIINLFIILMPGTTIIGTIITCFLSYVLTGRIFKRMGYKINKLPPFSTWQCSWQIIWGLIAGLSLLLLGDEFGLAWMSNTGKNILYVLSFIFTILGISVLVYVLKKWKARAIFKVFLLVIMLLYWPFTLSFVMSLGLLDSVINLRRKQKKKE